MPSTARFLWRPDDSAGLVAYDVERALPALAPAPPHVAGLAPVRAPGARRRHLATDGIHDRRLQRRPAHRGRSGADEPLHEDPEGLRLQPARRRGGLRRLVELEPHGESGEMAGNPDLRVG